MSRFSLTRLFSMTIPLIWFMSGSRCLTAGLCGYGQYLFSPVEGGHRCFSCPENEYMDETNHSHKKCKPCPSQGNRKCRLHGTVNYLIYVCDQGQYLLTSECKPCDNGTYMNDRQHTHNRCSDCAKPPCTGSNPYKVKDCDKISDVLCCPYPNMTWTESSTGPKCKNALLCPPGKYPSTNHQCLPCPSLAETERNKPTKRSTDTKAIQAACPTSDSPMLLSNVMSLTTCICVAFFFSKEWYKLRRLLSLYHHSHQQTATYE